MAKQGKINVNEIIADAKMIVELAKENAKEKLLESINPALTQKIEEELQNLLGEDDDTELIDEVIENVTEEKEIDLDEEEIDLDIDEDIDFDLDEEDEIDLDEEDEIDLDLDEEDEIDLEEKKDEELDLEDEKDEIFLDLDEEEEIDLDLDLDEEDEIDLDLDEEEEIDLDLDLDEEDEIDLEEKKDEELDLEDEKDEDSEKDVEDEVTVEEIDSRDEEITKLKEENAKLQDDIRRHRNALEIVKDQLSESKFENNQVKCVAKLFREFSLTENQKTKIIKRFDSLTESSELKESYDAITSRLRKVIVEGRHSSKTEVKPIIVESKKDNTEIIKEDLFGGRFAVLAGITKTKSILED